MAFRCEYCGSMVWVTFEYATLILNGEKKCKCPKCSKSKLWTLDMEE